MKYNEEERINLSPVLDVRVERIEPTSGKNTKFAQPSKPFRYLFNGGVRHQLAFEKTKDKFVIRRQIISFKTINMAF